MIARALLLTIPLMAAPLRAAISQSPVPRTITLRIDNDAFDFWMQPYNRPDEEYSSGVHITYDGGDAPRWARGSLQGRAACSVRATACRTGRMEIGQDIYTPTVSADNPVAAPGSRPNAGWLYLSQSALALDAGRSVELSMTVGVTGPPSLARFTQRIAHSAAPQFNRPTDWSQQIKFEPGAILKYEQRRRVVLGDAGAIGFDFIPRVNVSAGNVLTAAEAGFQTRAGWHLSHPWLPETRSGEIALTGGISGQAIARNLFLDGNSFADGPRVGHEPFVGAAELGVELRYRWINLAYRAVNQTRAYARGPKWHPWASMVGGVTFDR